MGPGPPIGDKMKFAKLRCDNCKYWYRGYGAKQNLGECSKLLEALDIWGISAVGILIDTPADFGCTKFEARED